MKFELIFYLLFLALSCFFLIQGIIQTKKYTWAGNLALLYNLTFVLFYLLFGLYSLDRIGFFYFMKYSQAFLLCSLSSYLGLVFILKIEELTTKKVKTLWRLPVIGILAGYYFESKWIFLAMFIIAVSSLLVALMEKDRLRYLIRKMVFTIIVATGFLYQASLNIPDYKNLLWIVGLFLVSSIKTVELVRAKELFRGLTKE